jgi:hypothetical protein
MRRVYLRANARSDHKLRTIALGVHEGRIVTNAQVQEHHWRLYALRALAQYRVHEGHQARYGQAKKFSEEIKAWEKAHDPHLKS